MSYPISGFTEIPNPQMLAFMPIQSYLMMYFEGSGWQYGKRKISAMSNEEFNKLTPEQLISQHSDELKRIMPTLEKTLNDVTPLISVLIEQYGDFIKEALAAIPQAVENTGLSAAGLAGPVGLAAERAYKAGFSQSQALAYAPYQLAQAARQAPPQLGLSTGQERRSTIPGLTVSQAREQAFNKQAAYEKKLEADRRARANLTTAQVQRFNVVPQVRPGLVKRPAGQSQKLERTNLMRNIADAASKMKKNRIKSQLWFQGQNIMKDAQQRLVNLLARYKF